MGTKEQIFPLNNSPVAEKGGGRKKRKELPRWSVRMRKKIIFE